VPEQYLARNSRTAWRVYDGEAVILLAEDSTLNTLNVEPVQAERDVTAFVDKLSQRGLLNVSASPHEPR